MRANAAVGAFGAGLAALAVAVVVDQRALGGQLAALFVVLLHRGARRREHFEDRGAAVLVEIASTLPSCALTKYSGNTVAYFCAAESVAVITTRPLPLSASRNGKLASVVLTTMSRPGTPVEQLGPVLGGQVGTDEVELGDVAVVGAVAEQDDQHEIVLRRRPS